MKITFYEVENWEKKYIKKQIYGHEIVFYNEPFSLNNIEVVKDTEILSVFIYSNLNQKALDQFPRLKLIATRSTGFDHIDLNECRRRHIAVCNVPSYGENTVAEHTFALILSLSRNLYKACIKRLTNDFSIKGLTGFDLKDKTLGVVGTGRIGLHVIRIGKGFGMNVLAYDVKQNELLAEVLGFSYVTLEQLLKESHIVTLHMPYNEQTHHIINSDKLSLMRKGAFLINTARGAVIDTEALIAALDNETLAGAGIDVLEGEEFIKEEKALLLDRNKMEILSAIGKNDILLRRQNVVYTPHIAFDSQEALERILDATVQNVNAFLAGQNCKTV